MTVYCAIDVYTFATPGGTKRRDENFSFHIYLLLIYNFNYYLSHLLVYTN